MGAIFSTLITTPFGYILNAIYSLVQNYGVAIILFTIVIKCILLPLSAKQQKSMIGMQKLQPEIEKLNKKYAHDKNKLQQETMKLYQENKVNPAGGCLPLLLQFPIIIGLYQVIRNPLQYMLGYSAELIEKIAKLLNIDAADQIAVANAVNGNESMIFEKLGESVEAINFKFLGLDLAQIPDFTFIDWIWLIPIVAALTSYITSIVTKKLSGNTSTANEQMKSMNIIMPLMSGYFCFIMPAGVGLYWIISNIVQIAQQYLLTSYYKRKDEKENNV